MRPEDFAQKIELAEWEHNQAKAIRDEPTRPSAETCADCGDEIPENRRLAEIGCTRCVDCQEQHEYEKNNRGRR